MLAHRPQAEFQGMFHQRVVALLQTRMAVVVASAALQAVLRVQSVVVDWILRLLLPKQSVAEKRLLPYALHGLHQKLAKVRCAQLRMV
jgi:hypothetical protein